MELVGGNWLTRLGMERALTGALLWAEEEQEEAEGTAEQAGSYLRYLDAHGHLVAN